MNGGPADPWRGEGGFLDTVLDGALVTAQIAALLDRDDGVDAALRGLDALSADDLRSAVFAAAADKMLDDRSRRRKRERRARLIRPWLWRGRGR